MVLIFIIHPYIRACEDGALPIYDKMKKYIYIPIFDHQANFHLISSIINGNLPRQARMNHSYYTTCHPKFPMNHENENFDCMTNI